MEEYRQNAINYVKENVECVGYRDYIVEQLEVPAVLLDRIKAAREEIFEAHKKHLLENGWSNIMIAVEIMDKLNCPLVEIVICKEGE